MTGASLNLSPLIVSSVSWRICHIFLSLSFLLVLHNTQASTNTQSFVDELATISNFVLHILTNRAVDARVLVVAEEEALFAAALVAAHCVDTSVLAPTVVELAFIHIYRTVNRSHE